ncbi:hypothetical protein Bca4012_045330 [Brassica carinata]
MIGSRGTGPEPNKCGLSFGFRSRDQTPTAAGTSPSEIMKERRQRWKPAVTALLINCQKLVVAKYGDSRAVICKDGLAKQLSDYHGPNMEKGVIENRGGFVEMLLEWMANWLWQGHLVMSNQEAVDSIKGIKDAMHLAEAQMISQWSSLSLSKLGSI